MKNIIEFINVRKEFLGGKIVANDKVSFGIKENTIHAIAGENGAGKSTLLSMLFGLYKQTSGEIKVKGKPIKYNSAADAMNNGLGMVQQHFQLVDKFTVVQNVTLGNETAKGGFVSNKESSVRINKLAQKYKFNVKAKDKVSSLSVGQEQKVEILKVLYRDSEILIFDEPTAMLTPSEIDELIEIMKQLKKQGKTLIIVTHKLDEIKRVADEVTILRKGLYVDTVPVNNITPQKLSKLMVGKDIKTPTLPKVKPGEKVLEVINLSVEKNKVAKLKDLNFDVRAGEILAVAGVEGNGQVELAETISGLNRKYTGEIKYNSESINKKTIMQRNEHISHIPEDRHKYGMILDLKSYENAAIKKIDEFSKFGVLNVSKMKKYAREIINQFDVRGANNGDAISRGLSGGNQQKLVVGRELFENNDVTIVFQATRGLDVGAINYIHKQIIDARSKGKAIILISYDLNEVLTLADRVIVLNSGVKTGEVSGKDINKAKIGQLMSGKGVKPTRRKNA